MNARLNTFSQLLVHLFALGINTFLAWLFVMYDENHHPYLLVFILASAHGQPHRGFPRSWVAGRDAIAQHHQRGHLGLARLLQ